MNKQTQDAYNEWLLKFGFRTVQWGADKEELLITNLSERCIYKILKQTNIRSSYYYTLKPLDEIP